MKNIYCICFCYSSHLSICHQIKWFIALLGWLMKVLKVLRFPTWTRDHDKELNFPWWSADASSVIINSFQRVFHSHHKYTPRIGRTLSSLSSENVCSSFLNNIDFLIQKLVNQELDKKQLQRKVNASPHYEWVFHKNTLFWN